MTELLVAANIQEDGAVLDEYSIKGITATSFTGNTIINIRSLTNLLRSLTAGVESVC
jgi:hypothetical protein